MADTVVSPVETALENQRIGPLQVCVAALCTLVQICDGYDLIAGSQTGANATRGKLYPARMRTSGIGWALGIGRLGGIAAPALGGYLLSIGVHPPQIFLSACGFALIAAIPTGLPAFRGSRSDRLATEPAE